MTSVDGRLHQLADRHALDAAAVDALRRLLALIDAEAGAPTAVRDPAVAVDVHVADALVALEIERVRDARRIADLGSGAGFPGLVLAVALPAARVALVEANGRRAAFLERAAVELRLENVEVVPERAEAWPRGIGTCDVVTARAVAPLSVLVEYAAPLLVIDGMLVAWKGRRDAAEEADGVAAAALTGLELAEVRPVRPWAGAEHLHLHLYVKVASTPNRFPRRPGMASKRPLQASG
ncbi:MAG TPA: 16S rRNA (guanine(527)-N(7))-methyltransferase RsmG [Solirubrobacteraceae bacterium]|nr:16S rRNA (guanine(527)-N(7))-methyltransferase RsmG [Solirubrobacteraceae bacterium]